MDKLRFTASARLGIWGTISGDKELFLKSLNQIIQPHSHGTIESNSLEFIPTEDVILAQISAICDKIISRGNPTIVDLNFENYLIQKTLNNFIKYDELIDSPNIGYDFKSLKIPGTLEDLLNAAKELLSLPYNHQWKSIEAQNLSPELKAITSHEEDLFYYQFTSIFGDTFKHHLHRQVLIRDLIDSSNSDLIQNRVDFAFQAGDKKWIFEIDGPQHNEFKQKNKDDERDKLLQLYGWETIRISTKDIQNNNTEILYDLHRKLSKSYTYNSVEEAVQKSLIHAAALYSIVYPIAVHKCMKGLLQLFLHDIIDYKKKQNILILEEDIPVASEALRMLQRLWNNIQLLAPNVPIFPQINLDYIVKSKLHFKRINLQGLKINYIDQPGEDYDIIISHSFLLDTGYYGPIECEYYKSRPANMVMMRHALGLRSERTLQWCEPIKYELDDVEKAILSQRGDTPEPVPEEKKEALLFFLRLIFRKKDFWDGQLHVLSRLLQGKPAIVLLPTGGGKSLTYQLSGLLLPGMTIIIDPLVSLMNDQVENLVNLGIDCVNSISSQYEQEVKESIITDMEAGRLAFTFISPERLQILDFRNRLKSVVARFPVSLAVVDEAHCVSEWGHDFRPSYLHMPRNLQNYCSDDQGNIPILVGLTGTASFAVLTDIQIEMNITDEEAIILPKSFDRKELIFDVIKIPVSEKPSALKTLKMYLPRRLRTNPQNFYDIKGDKTNSGIIFCPYVNSSLGVTFVSQLLGHNNYYSGKKPKTFVGDFSKWNEHKNNIQKQFKSNKIQELVSTKSFGMGIDKPNIRYTIHYTLPQSVEAFYQEAGRAGRNGIPGYALCAILYSDDNWDSAMEILNEPEHSYALSKLEMINWDDRGDILIQLWLLFNSYKGRSEEKNTTLSFWNNNLYNLIKNMPTGATNTYELTFRHIRREEYERSIFRLMILGVVQDYTINWQKKYFAIKVIKIDPLKIKHNIYTYLVRYKFADFAEKITKNIPEDKIETTIEASINVLIDFIYDEIVTKRKQALRTIGDMCRNFESDQIFRDAVLAYLQESEFSKELREWINKGFDLIGLNAIKELLKKVESLEQVKRLVGTTRRMLDEDPNNIALRYLSVCARAQSAVESDTSVIQETTTLILQIERFKNNLDNHDDIVMSLLIDVYKRRPGLFDKIGDMIFRKLGSASLANKFLKNDFMSSKLLTLHSVKIILSNVLSNVILSDFYKSIQKE